MEVSKKGFFQVVPSGTEYSLYMPAALAGFLGALVSLGLNMFGARIVGIETLKLLRIYATIIQGSAALDVSRSDFFGASLLLHIAAGMLFGMLFARIVTRLRSMGLVQFTLLGAGYGLAVWLINFYLILSWVQPLFYGSSFIVSGIPVEVAALTHLSYGISVALIIHPFYEDLLRQRSIGALIDRAIPYRP